MRLCLFGVGLVLSASACLAQDSDRSIDWALIRRADVQKELELVDDQSDFVNDNLQRLQKNLVTLSEERGLYTRDEVGAKLDEHRRDRSAVQDRLSEEILLPHQLQRLTELRWQYRVLKDRIPAFDLITGLQAEQRDKMSIREQELREELLDNLWAFQRRSMREMLDVLTPEQQAEWNKKFGKEFRFSPFGDGLYPLFWLR